MYIGKTVRYHHSDAISRNCPCSMLAAGARSPVGAGHHYLVAALVRSLAELWAVKHKILHRLTIGSKPEVMHESIAKITQVTGGSGHVSGRYYQVRVAVVYIDWNAG